MRKWKAKVEQSCCARAAKYTSVDVIQNNSFCWWLNVWELPNAHKLQVDLKAEHYTPQAQYSATDHTWQLQLGHSLFNSNNLSTGFIWRTNLNIHWIFPDQQRTTKFDILQ